MFEQLGLIGCGLMGGSFALAMKKAGLVKRVVGYSKSPSTTDRARQLGVIDVEAPSALLAVAGADIVLLAVPVAATEATLKAIKHLVTPQMLIMDVGSTKADVVQAARRSLRDQLGSFVPAHPITGREVSGVEHADAELYRAVRSSYPYRANPHSAVAESRRSLDRAGLPGDQHVPRVPRCGLCGHQSPAASVGVCHDEQHHRAIKRR
jgi:prephenate dehydrogenase (EC 1.3.1.12)